MKIYLAGPITGIEDLNIHEFREKQIKLQERGYDVLVPHDLFDSIDTTEYEWEDYMKVCIPAMIECDFVVTLLDWSKSVGTTMEVNIARQLKMPVETIVNMI